MEEKTNKFEGKQCSEESLKEWQKSFTDIEESIELVMKKGVDV